VDLGLSLEMRKSNNRRSGSGIPCVYDLQLTVVTAEPSSHVGMQDILGRDGEDNGLKGFGSCFEADGYRRATWNPLKAGGSKVETAQNEGLVERKKTQTVG
jgi:hypothetical protein